DDFPRPRTLIHASSDRRRRVHAREPFVRAVADAVREFCPAWRLSATDGRGGVGRRGAPHPRARRPRAHRRAGGGRPRPAPRPVPLAGASANPAGRVEDEAFERICALLIAELSKALNVGPLDGIYLDLHGAAVAVSFPDMEGEILRRVRAIVGDLPLTISLDPHANLTFRMVTLADVVVPFRTYPHVDMKDAGAQAMRLLLQRIVRGTPWARAFRQLEFS